MPWQKSKLETDPEIIKGLFAIIRKGGTLRTAADYIGISRRRIFQWLEKGRADVDAGNEETIHAKFALEYGKHHAAYVMELIEQIKACAADRKSTYNPLAFLITRFDPEGFGDKVRVDKVAEQILMKLSNVLDADTMAKVVEALEGASLSDIRVPEKETLPGRIPKSHLKARPKTH